MRILVANPKESKAYEQVLAALGHTVEVLDSPEAIVGAAGAMEVIDVAVVPLGTKYAPAIEALGRIKPHVYLIGIAPRLVGSYFKSAFDSGFDDVLSYGACSEEIAGRVEALTRIRRWARPADASEPGDSLSGMAFWETADLSLAAEFGGMMGTSFSVVPAAPRLIVKSAEISLTLPESGVEARIGVGIDEASLQRVSMALFGELVHADVLADAVREFANSAGGSLKRTALNDGKAFSLGLPQDAQNFSVPEGAKQLTLSDGDVTIEVWISMQSSVRERLNAAMLREGMVLAKDVKGVGGVLLFPAGRVLTDRTIERLATVVGPTALFEVSRAAA